MAIEIFNRYEHKYMLNESKFLKVLKIIEEHMTPDAYNEGRKPYTISNIYYDTKDDYLIRNSLSKPEYKEKLRLRAYGVPEDESKVYLEIKKKYKGIVNKRRTTLTLGEAYSFAATGAAPEPKEYMNFQVLKEIEYMFSVYDLVPKLYLAYDRLAYFEKDNPDLRISFDMNIRSRRYDLRLEAGDYGKPVIEEGEGACLMEIKTSLAKPLWVSHMLSDLDIRRKNFSKYGTEFKNYVNAPKSEESKRIKLFPSFERAARA